MFAAFWTLKLLYIHTCTNWKLFYISLETCNNRPIRVLYTIQHSLTISEFISMVSTVVFLHEHQHRQHPVMCNYYAVQDQTTVILQSSFLYGHQWEDFLGVTQPISSIIWDSWLMLIWGQKRFVEAHVKMYHTTILDDWDFRGVFFYNKQANPL